MKLHAACIWVAITVLGTACTWVKAKPGAENVVLVKEAHTATCKKLGGATAAVKHKLAILERKKTKVAEELLNLARNEAVKMGGDTLVSLSAPEGGSQHFDVYKCQ